MTEIAFRSGCPLDRWKQGLQIVLEKSPGVRLASKLRAILLMEADFNFGNKIYVGSRMLWQAMHSHQILPELYGGVKGRRADHMALARVLLINSMTQKRLPFAIASVDAQSCYDRIAHIPASLCCQRWGVPGAIMMTMLHTIQHMKFFLRTAFGDSSSFYGGGTTRFQGICQGNGAGPAVWLAISTCLVLGLYKKCIPQILRSALSGLSFSLLALIYVDDSDLFSFAPTTSSDPSTVQQSLLHAVHTWHRLLSATGGALSAEKCSWTLLAFKWRRGHWKLHTKESLPGEIYINLPNDDSSTHTIPRINPSDAIKVVGFHQALDGNMSAQLSALTTICERWRTALSQANLPRHFAWTVFRSKIWPSLQYPLQCTTITRNQGKTLMGRLYRVLLPRMGSNRNLPCAIRHGPPHLLGLNLPDPFIYQGSKQVDTFIQLFGSATNEGKLLQISLEQLQLEVGIQAPVLSTDFTIYGFLATPCWLTSLWHFLSHYHITLDIDSTSISLQREHDGYFMDTIFALRLWSPSQIHTINHWRLHQHILLLSDIFTGDGTRLRGDLLKGRGVLGVLPQPTAWPKQVPKQGTFTSLWLPTLHILSSAPGLSPLGSWFTSPHDDGSWEWWFSPTTTHVFRHQFGMWMRYVPIRARTTRQLSTIGHPYTPSDAVLPSSIRQPLFRATVYITSSVRVLYEGSSPSCHHASSLPASILSIPSILDEWGPSAAWPLRHSRFPNNGSLLATAIRNGSAHGVSDGSYMPGLSRSLAAAAWTLEDSLNPLISVCHGVTLLSSLDESQINAYRAELQGIHAMLLALTAVAKLHDIRSGSIRLYCDNERAIQLLSSSRQYVSASLQHHDLLRALHSTLSSLPITVSFEHIRGHQDRGVHHDLLSRPAQLNIRCDRLAKSFLQRSLRSPPELSIVRTHLKGEHSRCLIRGRKLTADITNAVTRHCTTSTCKEYILRKGALTDSSWDLVNWAAVGRAMEGKTDAYRLWASKFAYDKSATGANMVRWHLWDSPNCPCCGSPHETSWHVMQCSDPRVSSVRLRGLDSLDQWMLATSTSPDIHHCLIHSLRSNSPFSTYAGTTAPIRAAAHQQDSIGIANTYIARLSTKWEQLQSTYYTSISSRRSARAWASGLASQLLTLCHETWKARNSVVHDRALRGATLHEHLHLETVITEQFALGTTNLLPDDHHFILSRSLAQTLALPIVQRRIWIQSILWARQHGTQSLAAEAASMSHTMRSWLQGTL